jgi:peptidoglycan-associated lipoprotein
LSFGFRRFHKKQNETAMQKKMIEKSLRAILVVGIAGFTLVGCASTNATKPQPNALVPSLSPQNPAAQKPVQPAREPVPGSSLEAHREGQTPVSGPLKEIYFEFDKYDLNADARATLKADMDWLKANPSARVEIEGHCDERGAGEYNLALGAKRAEAAKEYLQSLGISPQRLSTISYGKELPACREQTEECYQKNRRDRFVIVGARPAS